MKIIWTDFAIQNLTTIFDYHVENATKKVAEKIKNLSKTTLVLFSLSNIARLLC